MLTLYDMRQQQLDRERAARRDRARVEELERTLTFAKWAIDLRMAGDDSLDLPFDEDLGEAQKRLGEALP